MSARQGLLALIIAVVATCVLANAIDLHKKFLDENRRNSGNDNGDSVQPIFYGTESGEVPIVHTKVPARNKKYQPCRAPGGKSGHCKYISNCADETFRYNAHRMMEFSCVIERQFVGVCCADDVKGFEDEVSSGWAESLPAIGTEGEDATLIPSGGITNRIARYSNGCGISPTNSGDWPWAAAIILPKNKCGGVLITETHVLTAAHCVYKQQISDVMVRLGDYDLSINNETRAVNFRVTEIRIHQYYNHMLYYDDIAIVKIHRPILFNTYIWPICLPPEGEDFENMEAIVIGWGQLNLSGKNSDVLMEASLPVTSVEKCNNKYVQGATQKHICAGKFDETASCDPYKDRGNPKCNNPFSNEKNPEPDACGGDSGGPLMYKLSNGRWVTIGIVSWGINCGLGEKPGIYTRVNSYLDWIFAHSAF